MANTAALVTTDLSGAVSRRSGKVRDIYDYGDTLLIVATDRISAFDVVMPTGIPGKGRILTGLTRYWFARTEHLAPNHMLTMDPAKFPAGARERAELLAGRAMLVKKAEVFPVECVVRGYLGGSGWREYRETGRVGGRELPAGLRLADKLPRPIFAPATKEESGHDVNITVEQAADMVGAEVAEKLEELSLALYGFAAQLVAERGFILCDTKFEFGRADSRLVLIDEVFTPDSSRYWDAQQYRPGVQQEAFDKQYLRDWLEELVAAGKWNKEYPGPELPDEVVRGVLTRYVEAYERITGEPAPV